MGLVKIITFATLVLLPTTLLKALSDSEILKVQHDAQGDKIVAREIISIAHQINQDFITLIDNINKWVPNNKEITKTMTNIEKNEAALRTKLLAMPTIKEAAAESLAFTLNLIQDVYSGSWLGEPTREWLQNMHKKFAHIAGIKIK